LLSTHVMAHAEQLCDHIVMIHLGDKVLDRSLSDIRQTFDPRHILFEPLDPLADVESLRSAPGVQGIEPDGPAWEITLENDAGPSTVIPALVHRVMPAQIQVRRPSLEDVFIGIVSGADAEKDADARLRAALREGEFSREGGR